MTAVAAAHVCVAGGAVQGGGAAGEVGRHVRQAAHLYQLRLEHTRGRRSAYSIK